LRQILLLSLFASRVGKEKARRFRRAAIKLKESWAY
jgi:hypothetical protein